MSCRLQLWQVFPWCLFFNILYLYLVRLVWGTVHNQPTLGMFCLAGGGFPVSFHNGLLTVLFPCGSCSDVQAVGAIWDTCVTCL